MTLSMVNLTARVTNECLAQFDALAAANGTSRSEPLRELVTGYIAGDSSDRVQALEGELRGIAQELSGLKQALGQVLVVLLINLPDEDGVRLTEDDARRAVSDLLRGEDA